jgi:hypothetical protein
MSSNFPRLGRDAASSKMLSWSGCARGAGRQLGYTYGPGSRDQAAARAAAISQPSGKMLGIRGINRGAIRGSFFIAAYRLSTVSGS